MRGVKPMTECVAYHFVTQDSFMPGTGQTQQAFFIGRRSAIRCRMQRLANRLHN
jgi:hypothetical protein